MKLRFRRLGLGVLATAASLLVSIPLAASPSVASAHVPDTFSGCLAGSGVPTRYRHGGDTESVSRVTKQRVQAELRDQLAAVRAASAVPAAATARSATTPAPSRLTVVHPLVVMHVIHGDHASDRNVTRSQARNLYYTLRDGFAGRQDPTMGPTGVVFKLRKITVTRNDQWFHAGPMSAADKQMRRKLHVGGPNVLNVYLTSPRDSGQSLLGYARFPWLASSSPALDGITINVISMNGGRATGYNRGDTIVHETGHWMGLFHTFEGGCDAPGDYVADTAAEGEPSFQCNTKRDTCPTPDPPGSTNLDPAPPAVPDPVRNFMDYSYDSCMIQFTKGQRERMIAAYLHYRAPR